MKKIHIAHVIYRFSTGGLENGVVNLINRLPEERYLHSIICITAPNYIAEIIAISSRNINDIEVKAFLSELIKSQGL